MAIKPEELLRAIAAARGNAICVPTMTTSPAWRTLAPDDLSIGCVGFMGGASSLGLGLALAMPERRVVVFDGDGSLLMQLGSLATIAGATPRNLTHLLFKNGVYHTSGSQDIPGGLSVEFVQMAKGAGYRKAYAVSDFNDCKRRLPSMRTDEDLLTGRETADIGQCCPTSFTTGNLVNFLKKESKQIGVEEVNKKYVYLTAGSCGACRFGQYHASYELALRNTGLERFRMFLMAQDNLDQNMGDGLDLNLPMTLGCLWGIFCTDLIQDLEYQVRPYEVLPGQTEAVVKESIEYLYQVFRDRPALSPKKSVLWHLTTPYFTRAMKEVRRKFSEIEV